MNALVAARGDSDGPAVMVILLASIALIVYLAFQRGQLREFQAMLRRVAAKTGGTLSEIGWLSEPSLTLTLNDRKARVEFFSGSKNRSAWTRVLVDVEGVSPGSIHILEEGFGQKFLKLFGSEDLEIGDARFDDEYVIRATPPTLVRALFSPERRAEGIRIVRRLGYYPSATLNVDAHTAMVKVGECIRDEGPLLNVIETAKDFVAFVLRRSESGGVTLGDVRPTGNCAVCGTAFGDVMLLCEECRTPQHAECWEYLGRCSTYACKGKRGVA